MCAPLSLCVGCVWLCVWLYGCSLVGVFVCVVVRRCMWRVVVCAVCLVGVLCVLCCVVLLGWQVGCVVVCVCGCVLSGWLCGLLIGCVVA